MNYETARLERVRPGFRGQCFEYEFKTPLRRIRHLPRQLLAARSDTSNLSGSWKSFSEHARRLARLKDVVLKLSRIEGGKARLILGRKCGGLGNAVGNGTASMPNREDAHRGRIEGGAHAGRGDAVS